MEFQWIVVNSDVIMDHLHKAIEAMSHDKLLFCFQAFCPLVLVIFAIFLHIKDFFKDKNMFTTIFGDLFWIVFAVAAVCMFAFADVLCRYSDRLFRKKILLGNSEESEWKDPDETLRIHRDAA